MDENEYIERKAAIKGVKAANLCVLDEYDMIKAISNIPTADVRPVVHGRWIGYPECLKYTNAYSDDHIVCSACEECFSILDNDCERFYYCPNCGARMEG